MNPGNKPSALVAVPNFNAIRMNAIIARDRDLNKTEFENIIWILGNPPAAENRWRIEAVKRTNDVEQVEGTGNVFLASTIDYREMLTVLENVWLQRRYKLHLSLGSLGSKMQHLGSFLFLLLHQEIAVWLAEPIKFHADRFSEGIGKVWLVDLGSLCLLRERFKAYRKFEWEL